MSAGPIRSTLPATTAAKLRTMPMARIRALAVLLGGAAGALARAGAEQVVPARPGQWPWATLIVNLVGSLTLAWLLTRLTEMTAPTRYVRFLLGTGFCGALTTFSTFQVETLRLAKDGHAALAAGYAVTSLAGGMLVAVLATIAARRRRYG